MTTAEINSQLEIVRLKDKRFRIPGGYCIVSGYALRHPELGYVSFNGETPYMPPKSALRAILDAGGFLTYEGMSWVREM